MAALLEIESKHEHVQPAIEAALGGTALSADDRGLLSELVNGVLRHRLHLDWALQQVAHETPYSKHSVMKQILRVGAYQLLMLERIPDYAAVDQAVELAKKCVSPKSAPLVNALLRELINRRAGLAVPDLLNQPLEHIAITSSHPRWLVKRWLKRFGAQRTIALCRFNNEPAPLTIRVNRLKLSVADYRQQLEAKGIPAVPCAGSPVGLRIDYHGPVSELPGYDTGWFYVQDEASQLVPLLLAPRRGEAVLDACAAPGGKATEIAEIMNNEGEILALDRSSDRLAVVEENCRRLGITCVKTVVGDATKELTHLGNERFDRILVDAPCSGLGVLRRHPEGKWSKNEDSILASAEIAKAILSRVAPLLKPKGVLVYSACSTEPEENGDVVDVFLSRHRNFRIENPSPLLPEPARMLIGEKGYFSTVLKGDAMDGFFAVRLVRTK